MHHDLDSSHIPFGLVNTEFTWGENHLFILHDSLCFDSGSRASFEIIENLIEDCKDMPQLPEWLGVYQTVVSANPITILPSSSNP